MTKEIVITNSLVVLVDDDWYEKLSVWKWRLHIASTRYYASRNAHIIGEQVGVYMHRDIMGCEYGDGNIVDHINRDGLDNRYSNLRIVSSSVNGRNTALYKNNTSGHKGVFWSKGSNKWAAQIKVHRKGIALGYFNNINDAVEARKQGEIKYWGEARTP